MSIKRNFLLAGISVFAVTAGVLTAYQGHSADAAVSSTAPPPPPAVVTTLQEQKVDLWKDFTGRLQAVDYVEIRPEVSGKIQVIKFDDGQIVNKGDVLMVIDPTPYKAAVDKAKADLQTARNKYELAQKDLARASDLVKTEAISKKIFDQRQNEAQVSKSQVDSADAQLKQAQIDLDHAYVKAPIGGRISRAEITAGNLVQANANAPILTTIVSNEGIYADFDVDEQTYLNDIYAIARDTAAQTQIPVQIVLKSGNGEPYKGVIKSFDNKIDPKSGTIRVRAYLQNEDQSLLPGMFVNVRLGGTGNQNAILVSEKAIGTDQDRKFVYVVGDGDKVAYREIKSGSSVNGQRVILSGLKAGERVITEGIMKIHPDMVVTPKTVSEMDAPPSAEPSAQ